jgi:ferredoxin-NADP reductase
MAGNSNFSITTWSRPASRHLHDQVKVGDIINSHLPAGDLVLAKADRPVVLISAGVGVAPMVSMLHALVSGPLQSPVWVLTASIAFFNMVFSLHSPIR